MDTRRLMELGLNMEELVRHMGGSREMAFRFVKKFPQDHSYEKLEEAFEQGDYETAYQYAHQLKGLTANLCMERMNRELNGFLDSVGRKDAEGAKIHREEFRRLYLKTCEEIRRLP